MDLGIAINFYDIAVYLPSHRAAPRRADSQQTSQKFNKYRMRVFVPRIPIWYHELALQ
jgi:hypothetical protein